MVADRPQWAPSSPSAVSRHAAIAAYHRSRCKKPADAGRGGRPPNSPLPLRALHTSTRSRRLDRPALRSIWRTKPDVQTDDFAPVPLGGGVRRMFEFGRRCERGRECGRRCEHRRQCRSQRRGRLAGRRRSPREGPEGQEAEGLDRPELLAPIVPEARRKLRRLRYRRRDRDRQATRRRGRVRDARLGHHHRRAHGAAGGTSASAR